MQAMVKEGWTTNDVSRALNEEEEGWLRQPIHTLSLTQRVDVMGAITRFHPLPTLYCQLDSTVADKELALLDSGSECNVISNRLARKY